MNIQVELTNICNLSCVECPHRLMKRKKQHMENDVWETILEDYIRPLKDDSATKGHPPTLILHKDGEPLIHPKLLRRIRDVSQIRPDIKMDIYTNGTLLNKDFLNDLGTIRSKFRILISFHFYNWDGTKNDYTEFMKQMKEFFKTDVPRNLEIIFTSHITRFSTEEMLLEWKKNWAEEISDKKLVMHINPHINPWTGLISEKNCVQFDGCPYADFNHLFIGVTGNVIACCMDLEEQITFGNIMIDPKDDIMDRVDMFYDMMSKNQISAKVCEVCIGKK